MTLKEFGELQPSVLVTLALRMLIECEEDYRYVISITDHHVPRSEVFTSVGLGGCIMAKFFGAPPDKELHASHFKQIPVSRKLQALMYLALGEVDLFLQYGWPGQHGFPERKAFDKKQLPYTGYIKDPNEFRNWLQYVINYLTANNL